MNEKQNVILLTIDSLRADHLGCLGYSKDITPNIDKLASEGLLFWQAISNGGVTGASFPSIITSSYPNLHPIKKVLFRHQQRNVLFLSSNRTTIGEVLRENGYSTAAFSAKNPWISSFTHYNRGFDIFDDQLYDPDKLRYYLLGIGSNKASVINKKAIQWLRKNKSSFFLWLHYMDVHEPYNPGSFVKRIEAFILSKKKRDGKNLSEYELRMLIRIYDSAIMYVDHEIGCLLDELERMGISHDNTYIILTSDHGEQFIEHGEVGHGALYDEVLHVPLIISGRGIEKSTVIKNQVPLLDLSPTIVDLLHLPIINSFQGRSLLPLINGVENKERAVISEGGLKQFSYRTEEWKYILTLDEGNMKAELYNLHRDPGEKENLVKIEKTKEMEFQLSVFNHIAMEEQLNANKIGELVVYSIEEKRKIEKRLKDLGYI